MIDWSPPEEDLAAGVNMGEGLDRSGPMRVSPATQAARDQQAALLRAKYEPGGDPTNLATVEPIIQAKAGGKSKLAAVLRDWTPPEAQAPKEAFKPPEADADAAPMSLADQLLQPWKGESLGSLASQNVGVRLYNYAKNVGYFQSEIAQEKPDAGFLEVAGLATQRYKEKFGQAPELDINWSDLPKQFYDQITKTPAMFASSLIKSIIVDPELLLVAESKAPQALAAAGRPIASAAVKMGEVAGQMAAQGAAISAVEQLEKTGDVQAQPTLQAGASTAVAGALLHTIMGVGLRSVGKGKGADVTPEVEKEAAQRFDAKVDDGMAPNEAVAATLREAGMGEVEAQRMGAAVAPINDALENALRAMDEERGNATGEGIKPQGDVAEHQDGNQVGPAAEAGGGDRLQRGGQEPAPEGQQPGAVVTDIPAERAHEVAQNLPPDTLFEFETPDGKRIIIDGQGVEHEPATATAPIREGEVPRLPTAEPDAIRPQSAGEAERQPGGVPTEGERAAQGVAAEADHPQAAGDRTVRSLEDYQRRVQTGVEGLEGEAKYEALRDTAAKLRAAQGGEVDPRLLVGLGLGAAGATVGFMLNRDPKQALAGAIGLPAAVLLARKFVNGASALNRALADKRYRITHLTDDFDRGVRVSELSNMRASEAMKAFLPDEKARTKVMMARERGNLSDLSPKEKAYAGILDKAFADYGTMGQKFGKLPEELLPNYVTHLWVKGVNTTESLMQNLKDAMLGGHFTGSGMANKTRFAKMRSIPSYEAGIKAGLVPTTLDPAVIFRVYADSVSRAIHTQKFIDALKAEKTHAGEPIMVSGDKLDAEVRRRIRESMGEEPIDPAAKTMVEDISAIKAPRDYVALNHPLMSGMRVHPDVEAPLKALFEANDANAATRAALALSIAAKRGLFSFSLFHAMSLLHAQLGAPLRAWKYVPSALKMLREGGNDHLNDLVGAGLGVVRKPLEADVAPLSNAMRVIEAKAPIAGLPVRGVRWVQEHMDHFLWDVVHPSFKVATGLAAYEKLLTKGIEQPKAAKMAASFTNDIFGGLDWFKIADSVHNKYGRDLALAFASPSGRRFMQIAMLAPDWTVATTRAMAKAIPGVSEKALGSLHRGYVLQSALIYLSVAEGLNQAFSGHHLWQNEDPTMVDLGDGRKMQLSKHFMEPVHWLTKPAQQALNKLGYVPAETLNQLFGTQYLSTKGAPPMDTSLPGRVGHALKKMLPIPSTVAAEQGAGPALSGLIGLPIYGKTEQQAVDATVERALGLKQQRDESGSKIKTQTQEQAEKRARKAYEKRRAEQEARNEKSLADRIFGR